MKEILVLTNYFYPENFKVNELIFRLSRKGHRITVITAIPNYPTRDLFKDKYTFFQNRKEYIDGVTIIRLPLIYRGSGSSVRLVLNYLSFLFISCFYAIYLSIFKKIDILFVHHVSPIFIAIPAIIIKFIKRRKIVFWNLDLWPEALLGTADVKNNLFLKILNRLIFWINKQIDFMLVSSKGFVNPLTNRGVKPNSIIYFPNWVDDNSSGEESEFIFPDGFSILFAGNLGQAQDPESIFKLIENLNQFNINWIFIGGGRSMPLLKDLVSKVKIRGKVFFPGVFPLNQMNSIYKQADLLLISLNRKTSYTLPGRVQAYMNAGKPIMGMVNGETQHLINDTECGICYESGDYENLSKAIQIYLDKNKEELEEIGKRGYLYSIENFSIENNLKILEKLFLKYESALNR